MRIPSSLPHPAMRLLAFINILIFLISYLKSFKKQDGEEGKREREALCDILVQPIL